MQSVFQMSFQGNYWPIISLKLVQSSELLRLFLSSLVLTNVSQSGNLRGFSLKKSAWKHSLAQKAAVCIACVWVVLTVCKSHTKKKWSFPWRASNCQPFLSRGKHKLLHCKRGAIKLSCPYALPELIVLLRNHSLLRLIDIKTLKKTRHLSVCQPHLWVLAALFSNALNRRSLWGCESSWKSLTVLLALYPDSHCLLGKCELL